MTVPVAERQTDSDGSSPEDTVMINALDEVSKVFFDNHENFSQIEVVASCLPAPQMPVIGVVYLPDKPSGEFNGYPLTNFDEHLRQIEVTPPEELRRFALRSQEDGLIRQYVRFPSSPVHAVEISVDGLPEANRIVYVIDEARSIYPGEEEKAPRFLHQITEAVVVKYQKGKVLMMRTTGIAPTYSKKDTSVRTEIIDVYHISDDQILEPLSKVSLTVARVDGQTPTILNRFQGYDSSVLELLQDIVKHGHQVSSPPEDILPTILSRPNAGFSPCQDCLNTGLYLPQKLAELLLFQDMLQKAIQSDSVISGSGSA